jgi:hypothetical protein
VKLFFLFFFNFNIINIYIGHLSRTLSYRQNTCIIWLLKGETVISTIYAIDWKDISILTTFSGKMSVLWIFPLRYNNYINISQYYQTQQVKLTWHSIQMEVTDADSCHKSFRELDMFSIVDTTLGVETRAKHSSTPKLVSTIENISRSLNNT